MSRAAAFARELAGLEYCFAHNGTLERFQELPLRRFRPVGSTDSEHLFCHLMDELAIRDSHLASEANWQWLHGKFTTINRMGRLNCLLSDGQRLLCYRDATGWKGLAIRKVNLSDHQVRSFEDPTLRVELEGQSVNRGYVLATRPLSSTGWHNLQPGELMVLEGGMIQFSSHRSGHGDLP